MGDLRPARLFHCHRTKNRARLLRWKEFRNQNGNPVKEGVHEPQKWHRVAVELAVLQVGAGSLTEPGDGLGRSAQTQVWEK
jgi:hypothetical protein